MPPSLPTLAALVQSFQAAAERFAASVLFADLAALRSVRLQVCEALGAFTRVDADALAPLLQELFAQRRAVGLTSFRRTPDEDAAFAHHLATLRAAPSSDATGHLFAALLLSWHACEVGEIERAIALPPALRPLWAKLAFEMPELMLNDADADALAEHLTALCLRVRQVLRGPGASDDLVDGFFSCSAFLQCYFSESDLRTLMTARAGLLEDAAVRIGVGLDQCLPLAPLRERLRVGFIAMGPVDNSEGAYLAAHLKHLDRSRIEPILFSLPTRSGVLGEACASYCDRVVDLPDTLDAAIAQVRAYDLDIALFVNNVTAVVHSAALMGVHRLARIQMMNLASPVTTGFRNIDFMLTGQFNEPEDAAAHYSERLVYVAGASNCYDLAPLVGKESAPVSRAQFGIPPDAVLYYSSATSFKLRPRVLDTWIEILRRVPNSYLMLMPFGSYWGGQRPAAALSELLRERCAKAGVADSRIVVAPAVPSVADLHAVMRIADVFLDTFPFSAAISMYDAVCAGLPYVARAGTQSRGLHSAAISEEAGLFDWIAATDEDYIARAAALGLNQPRRTVAKARAEALRTGDFPLTDMVTFGVKFTAALTAVQDDWNAYVAHIRALPPRDIATRIGALSAKVAPRLGVWGETEIVQSLVTPYVHADGVAAMVEDVAHLETVDLATQQPRLMMAKFRDRDIADVLARMEARGYRACVFHLRPAAQRTQLAAIVVDAPPPVGASGCILFFPRTDALFLPSVLAWLDALAGENRAPLYAYGSHEDADAG